MLDQLNNVKQWVMDHRNLMIKFVSGANLFLSVCAVLYDDTYYGDKKHNFGTLRYDFVLLPPGYRDIYPLIFIAGLVTLLSTDHYHCFVLLVVALMASTIMDAASATCIKSAFDDAFHFLKQQNTNSLVVWRIFLLHFSMIAFVINSLLKLIFVGVFAFIFYVARRRRKAGTHRKKTVYYESAIPIGVDRGSIYTHSEDSKEMRPDEIDYHRGGGGGRGGGGSARGGGGGSTRGGGSGKQGGGRDHQEQGFSDEDSYRCKTHSQKKSKRISFFSRK